MRRAEADRDAGFAEYAAGKARGYRVIDVQPEAKIFGATWIDLGKVTGPVEGLDKEEKNLDYHDITLYAKYEPKTYVITYHIGNASSTAGATAVATSTCKYNENCVLTNFDTFSKQFPYSKADHDKNGADNYGWKFAGWTTDMDAVPKADNLFDINYSNSASFTYNIDWKCLHICDLFSIIYSIRIENANRYLEQERQRKMRDRGISSISKATDEDFDNL